MKIRFADRAFFVPLFIFLNLVVYFLWVVASSSQIESQFMIDNFLVSWTAIAEGRYWTLWTSVFSHNLFWHFLLNMYVLNSFGRIVEVSIGKLRFLKFYLFAGLMGSLGHIFVSKYFLQQPDIPALGASGAISGVILLFSLMYPKEKILILGFIPVPAIWGALLVVGLDIWGLIAQSQGGGLPIGHGAHLGGALGGLIYYFIKKSDRR